MNADMTGGAVGVTGGDASRQRTTSSEVYGSRPSMARRSLPSTTPSSKAPTTSTRVTPARSLHGGSRYKLGCIQVWDDAADTDGVPLVGFFGKVYADSHEFRWDLFPDQALDLAAMLVVHAMHSREAALERALEDEDGRP